MYVLDLPWLLLLLPLPWLLQRWLPGARQRQDALRLPFFHQLAGPLGLTPANAAGSSAGWLATLLEALAWCLLVVALAAPSRLEPPLVKSQPLRDLLLAVDTSMSMANTDAGDDRSRLWAVQQVLDAFVQRRASDRLGLLVFGDEPYTQTSFTQDHATLRQLLAELQPGVAGRRTALGDSIGLAIRLFQQSQNQERVLILLSDGSDTASRKLPDEAAQVAADQGIIIHTIGFGDPDGEGEQRLDAEQLQRIASSTGGRYLHASNQAELAAAFAALDRLTPQLQQRLAFQPRTPLYHYPLAAAIVLLLLRLLLALPWLQRRPA
ncbi:VWA domain-containing protein [Halopseudomonas maritima]|uniref:VWA domain-containing protein n=1 Tax=Halopseudomonas maritima TaxID=2918528 RepID=UPI001EECC9E0|nr:VWA domain-containing protein [Halopseudomonas maritima]UJJ33083.1 VWA domain-containing protein [Halopseudomonas maritima]